MRRRKVNLISGRLLQMLLALVAIGAGRSEAPSREYQVKAAFIYNFMQFVEWPAEAFDGTAAPFIVGIAGSDPFEGSMEKAVAEKTVGSRPIIVKHFSSENRLEPCQLIYLPAGQHQWLVGISKSQAGRPVLIVGEGDGFLGAGGMIRFYTEDNKLRFEIRLETVERARLKISSKLLKLAKIYTG